MLTPRDPDAFKAEVLRRAMRIERRRRRARVIMAVPAVLALVLGALLVAERSRTDDTADLATADSTGELASEVVTGYRGDPVSVVGGTDGSVWVLSHIDAFSELTRFEGSEATERIQLDPGVRMKSVVAGTDRALWGTTDRSVVRIDEDGDTTTFPTEQGTSSSGAWAAGRFWFAEPALDRITGIAPDGDTVHHTIPAGRMATVVSAGPDGNVWYGSETEPILGSVTPDGAVAERELPASDQRVLALAPGPGPSLWMVLQGAEVTTLARVDPDGGIEGEPIAVLQPPTAISVGPDGRLWLTPGDGMVDLRSVTRLTVRDLGRPLTADAWALASDDSMWAVDRHAGTVVRIATD